MQNPLPVVVDLDDTLARTDFFYESLLKFIKLDPLNFFRAVMWLITKDKAYLKSRIVEQVTLDSSLIPYNEKVIDYIKIKKQQNHPIILATATHRVFADAVANHLKLFDQVFATDDNENLKGVNKEKKLIKEFGEKAFIYVGDSQADLKVWRSAKAAVAVSPSKKLQRQLKSVTKIETIISDNHNKPSMLQVFYSFDWFRNVVIFLPLLVAGQWDSLQNWFLVFIAFASFCLITTSINIFDELFDLDVLRLNKEPGSGIFAFGHVGITSGVWLTLICLSLAVFLSLIIGKNFTIIVLVYFIFLIVYSIYLKLFIPKVIIYLFIITVQILAGYLIIFVDSSTGFINWI